MRKLKSRRGPKKVAASYLFLSPEEAITAETYNKPPVVEDSARRPPSTRIWKKELLRFQNLCPKGKILDLGCGPGKNISDLASRKHSYVGIDIAERMVRRAKMTSPSAALMQMNMHTLGFKEKSFSGVWAPVCLFHIPKRSIYRVLGELQRVLVPGGIGFIVMHRGTGGRYNYVGGGLKFFAYYHLEEFASILEESGFAILDHYEDFQNHQPPRDYTVWLCYFVQSASD